jgi:hypothetical protein
MPPPTTQHMLPLLRHSSAHAARRQGNCLTGRQLAMFIKTRLTSAAVEGRAGDTTNGTSTLLPAWEPGQPTVRCLSCSPPGVVYSDEMR